MKIQSKTNMTKNINFLFHTKKQIERPENVLQKDPNDYDLISLEEEITMALKATKNVEPDGSNINKPQRLDEEPVMMDILVKRLACARAIQRPFDIRHVLNIGYHRWDSRKAEFPLVVHVTTRDEYWIIEGNHRSIAKGMRAATGKYPDFNAEDWKNFPVRCQVIELTPDESGNINLSFARDMFEGSNGDDKKKLDYFDIYKNKVLRVRQDCNGDVAACDDNQSKKMYRIQLACEKNNLCPVHPNSGRDQTLAGAITHINALMKMTPESVEFTGRQHNKFWDDLPVDAFELSPMNNLYDIIIAKDPDALQSKELENNMEELAIVMQKFGGTPAGFRGFATDVWKEYYLQTKGSLVVVDKKKKPKIPAPDKHFSLVLLLKLHKKVGYTCKFIPDDIYTKFNESGIDCLDCLSPAKKKILRDFV